jgi:nucleotide-binding universal stress UspA family protein
MDGSEMSERALKHALATYPDAEITVLHVVGAPSWFMGEAAGLALADDLPAAMEERAEEVLGRVRALAAEHGAEIDTAVGAGTPSWAIVERAANFDAVVIGGHGRDLSSRLLLGDVAATVVR